jgi:hypothetical protein
MMMKCRLSFFLRFCAHFFAYFSFAFQQSHQLEIQAKLYSMYSMYIYTVQIPQKYCLKGE